MSESTRPTTCPEGHPVLYFGEALRVPGEREAHAACECGIWWWWSRYPESLNISNHFLGKAVYDTLHAERQRAEQAERELRITQRHMLALFFAIDEVESHLFAVEGEQLRIPACEWEGVKRIANAVEAEQQEGAHSDLIDQVITTLIVETEAPHA